MNDTIGMITVENSNFRFVMKHREDCVKFNCRSDWSEWTLTAEDLFVYKKAIPYADWDTGDIRYNPEVNVQECKEKYKDTRVSNMNVEYSNIKKNTDIIFEENDDYGRCDICGEREPDGCLKNHCGVRRKNGIALHIDCIAKFICPIIEGLKTVEPEMTATKL